MLAAGPSRRYSAAMPKFESDSVTSAPLLLASFAQALEILIDGTLARATECVALEAAGGRRLAVPVHAMIDSPRRDAAAMDGFAVGESLACDTGPHWKVIDPTGSPALPLGPGEAQRIATGAALPPATHAVLPIEWSTVVDGHLTTRGTPGSRSHVRRRGSDFMRGDRTLPGGRRIDPRALVAIAAADVATVEVWRKPRVAVIACGAGQVAPGDAARTESATPDGLSEALLLFAADWGADPIGARRIGAAPAALAETVAAVMQAADVIVLVGGAAHGARDASQRALDPLGLGLCFDGLTIRPGRPSWYGRIEGVHVLGLPGNPTAAMTVARLLLAPLLLHLGGGDAQAALAWEELPLASPAAAAGARESFLCGSAAADGVQLLDRRSVSGQLMLASADRLIWRPADGEPLVAGASVPTLRF